LRESGNGDLTLGLHAQQRLINSLCVDAGRAPVFVVVESDDVLALATIKPDTFYGVPLAAIPRPGGATRGKPREPVL
jgi:hypothetical protein